MANKRAEDQHWQRQSRRHDGRSGNGLRPILYRPCRVLHHLRYLRGAFEPDPVEDEAVHLPPYYHGPVGSGHMLHGGG